MTRIRYILIVGTSLLFNGLFLHAQDNDMVKSTAYRLMLKSLLSGSVPQTGPVLPDSLPGPETIQFVDARERAEYDVSHITDATWVGYDDFDPVRLKNLDRNRPVIVYCSVGYRSEKIGEKLLEMGFSQVYNLYGGIFEWVNQGNAVVDSTGKTDRVHAYSKVWGIWLKSGKKVYR